MKTNKLIIVDDHALFRGGIMALLIDHANIEVVAQAATGQEFLDYIQTNPVDIALMDINMPGIDGIEATRRAMEKFPNMKIIALTMFGQEEYYWQMVEAGVKGFLLKDSGAEDLEKALQAVINGTTYFSQSIMQSLITHFGTKKKNNKEENKEVKLSEREIEVLEYICKGLSNQEIADVLFLSHRTVERHRANLLSKTATKNSTSLVVFAIKNKLVDI